MILTGALGGFAIISNAMVYRFPFKPVIIKFKQNG